MTSHVYFKCFLWLFVIIEHIWVFWVDLFLICLWLSMFEWFLKCSYFGPKVETRCSYKIVLITKKRVLPVKSVAVVSTLLTLESVLCSLIEVSLIPLLDKWKLYHISNSLSSFESIQLCWFWPARTNLISIYLVFRPNRRGTE